MFDGQRFLLAALLLGVAPACRNAPDLSKVRPPGRAKELDPPGREEERTEVDPKTGKTTHEWSVIVTPGRGTIKHGVERLWFPDGSLWWEREFHYGKPTGIWRSYWENGKPRTECFYLGADVERTMTFWREDGKLSAQGPACDGARRGKWRFWWANGQLAEEGEYRSGLKEGSWIGWSRDGKRHFERVYEKNVRVSQREVADSASAPESAPQ
jgi:antitoxin component YwqK of YwqJK toxin-antitoxin module